jgi:hypothetical protein
MIQQGKISFRTCFQAVLIPASYVLFLAGKDYAAATGPGPKCFRDAFAHWMLCETLNAIGSHTIM